MAITPPSEAQRQYLSDLGHRGPEPVSSADAGRLIEQLRAARVERPRVFAVPSSSWLEQFEATRRRYGYALAEAFHNGDGSHSHELPPEPADVFECSSPGQARWLIGLGALDGSRWVQEPEVAAA